jgi:hypothetical protein
MNRITGALAALALGASLATACTTTKPSDDATQTDGLGATNSATQGETTGKTNAGDATRPDGLVDAQAGKEVEGLGELLVTAGGALDAYHFRVAPFPKDHTVFLTRDWEEGTRTYVVLDGQTRHVATLIEAINNPELPFPPERPAVPDGLKYAPGGTFQVADSEFTRDQPRGVGMKKASIASRYFTYELQMLGDVDATWIFSNFTFNDPDALRCDEAQDCPIQYCDCGEGNSMSTTNHPCYSGTCALTAGEPCEDLCQTADFNEFDEGIEPE